MPEIKAVLVSVHITVMPNCREDKELTEEFRTKKQLGKKAGKWSKYVLPNHALEQMRKIASDFRNKVHYKLTLPWEDGKQLLPANANEQYNEAASNARTAFLEEKAVFGFRYQQSYNIPRDSREAMEYFDLLESVGRKFPSGKSEFVKLPSLVDQAKIMHGSTFNESLYPPWRLIADRYDFKVEHSPVPKASHFITAGIAKDAVDEMRAELETRNEQRVQAAVSESWHRLFEPVKAIADKLSGKDTIFRDSIIGNVKEICALIPALNLTSDNELAALAKRIEKQFADLDPNELRTNVAARREATAAARSLVQSFGKIGARRFA